jgi:glycosyltransferase involved in cell wall biosynthesis
MRILIVAPYYLPYASGMTAYCQELAEGLAKKGHKITVLTSKHLKNLKERETVNNVKILRVPVLFRFQRGAFSPTFLFHFIKLVKNFDVVNIHTPLFEVGTIALAANALGKKTILTYHCDLSLKNGILSSTVEKLYYFSVFLSASLVDKIVVNSIEYAKTSRIKRFLDKTVQIFPPVDASKFHKVRISKEFKRKYSIEESDFVIGSLGRITREKGFEYLIRAIPKVNKQIRNVKVLIGGESEKIVGGKKESEKEKLLETIEDLKLDNVSFIGYVHEKEKNQFYSACDVFVLPSISRLESFGIVQIESMLCGTPVVATDLPGIRVIIKLTNAGILFKSKSYKELAKSIVFVFKNKKRFKKNRKYILAKINLENTIEKYEEILSSKFT